MTDTEKPGLQPRPDERSPRSSASHDKGALEASMTYQTTVSALDTALTGPVPAQIVVTTFRSAGSTDPKSHHVPWHRIDEKARAHMEYEDKKRAPLWSPATYPPGAERKKQNVESVTFFAADLDHVTWADYDAVKDRLLAAGLAFVAHSTYRHTADEPRLRVLVPFTEPVPASEWDWVWQSMDETFFGGRLDPQTKDASRMMYVPSCPPDGPEPFTDGCREGKALDWTHLPKPEPKPVQAREQRRTADQRGILQAADPEAAAGLLAKHWPELGKRHAAHLALVGGLMNGGWSADDAGDFALGVAEAGGSDPKEYAESNVRTTEQRLANGGQATGWPTLASIIGDDVVSRVREWLGLAKERTAQGDGSGSEPLTDMGNAERLVARHGQDFRYVPARKGFVTYDGRRWVDDQDGEMTRRAVESARSRHLDAYNAASVDDAQQFARHARYSESARGLTATLSLVQSVRGVSVQQGDFDADPHLLNLANGTLDTRTSVLHPHRREDHIMKMADVEYDPDAACPTWEAFLERVLPDADVRAYVQRAVGYSLTGSTSEQCLFLLYGLGANGKSVFLNTIRTLLGDYGQQADFSTFAQKKGDGPRDDLAKLAGARLVVSSEVEAGKRLSEVVVKQATGGDPLVARFLFKDLFEYTPAFKLWMAGNHKPVIRQMDHGIWRRIHLVPFTVTIPEAERDNDLERKLRAELPGVLAWALKGLRSWRDGGLRPPAAVRGATEEYREGMDTLAEFLDEHCILEDDATAPTGELFQAYDAWAYTHGEEKLTKRTFGMRLEERGFRPGKSGSVRHWKGLRLRPRVVNGALRAS